MPAPKNIASRLWQKDVSLWRGDANEIEARLGWLDAVDWMGLRADEVTAWAKQTAASGDFDRAILIGMGGASLAAAVFASLFKPARGMLPVEIFDTTNPDEINQLERGDLSRCLFIIASKSGGTIETLDLYDFFREHIPNPAQFIVITDADSPLHHRAQTENHRVFLNAADTGGRFSALSYFGMLPAALLGVDIEEILRQAAAFCATTQSDQPSDNPALALGMHLGQAACDGRDKMVLHLPPKLRVFGLWVEQLIAESTGKDGKGLLPVIVDDGTYTVHSDSDDCIHISYDGAHPQSTGWELTLADNNQLGAEFFRWQFATAVAAAYIQVNPFNQPDVAQSKKTTRALLVSNKTFPPPITRTASYDLHGNTAADFTRADYLALLAYLPEDPRLLSLLQTFRARVSAHFQIPATLGFGPRYLHSTGQLHKGGARGGNFIQFIADNDGDCTAPQRTYSFAQLFRAQADGDFLTLANDKRAIMRVHLKADTLRALTDFTADFFATPDAR